MQFSADGSYVITASLDKTAKLVDVNTLEVRRACARACVRVCVCVCVCVFACECERMCEFSNVSKPSLAGGGAAIAPRACVPGCGVLMQSLHPPRAPR